MTAATGGDASLGDTPDAVAARLAAAGYLADDQIAAAVHLAIGLRRPLLLEGPPGVGKTSLAQAVAAASGRRLVRLQCHEGLDAMQALYEWDYGRQLLATQLLATQLPAARRASSRDDHDGRHRDDHHHDDHHHDDHHRDDGQHRDGRRPDGQHDDRRHPDGHHPDGQQRDRDDGGEPVTTTALFTEEFLLERPLLTALRSPRPVVLLIDELDRADDALDALLLETLDERQVTIPELGTVVASSDPWVFITSNETRELADAVRRRCLRIGLTYPQPDREAQIIESAVPGITRQLQADVVDALRRLRDLDLEQPPGVSEGLDWAQALLLLAAEQLDDDTIDRTLLTIVKRNRDVEVARTELVNGRS